MSKVYTDTVTSTEASQDLTLGGSGDNVIVTAGATLKTNTIKDSGGNTIWTSDGSGNLSSVNAALGGNMVLLSSQTASNSASVSFTSGIDSTYKLYIFKMYGVNPASDTVSFGFQGNAAGASGYNETITSAFFRAYHAKDDSGAAVTYLTNSDQTQGTDFQLLAESGQLGNAADEALSGTLWLFNPSNTTYVNHFYARTVINSQGGGDPGNYAVDAYTGGYFNTTSAIDEIQFKMNSGNFDGTIKMYGLG